MSTQRNSYAIRRVDAKCIMDHHLRELQGHQCQTIDLHRRVITGLLSFLAQQEMTAGAHLCFSEEILLRWIVTDVRGKSNTYAASRLQIMDRYIGLLCKHGVLPDNPLQQIRAGASNPSWNRIVDISQSPQPLRRLRKLQPKLPPHGPLYAHLEKYIALHQSLGKGYATHVRVLNDFDSFLAKLQISSPNSIRAAHIQSWLEGLSCSRAGQLTKLYIVKRYMDYLIGVAVMKANPAVPIITEFGRMPAQRFQPFIISEAQIAAILEQAKLLPPNHLFKLRPQTCHTMLVLLYALGLRSREVCNLRFCDIDMQRKTLLISGTKFYKSRLLPFGPKVGKCLKLYMATRRKVFLPVGIDDPLFITYRRQPIRTHSLGSLFHSITSKVIPDVSPLPRIHDLRHTFAVHRLLRWYRQGADVQSKLLLLSTFMGHVEINSTEVYLTITLQLLEEANARFYQHCGTSIGKGIHK